MGKFKISPRKEKKLRRRMKKFKIYEKDLKEKFVRPSGKGGQKSDKTSNCVYIKHIPTEIEVKCQKSRSRSTNRFLARRNLTDKIENKILGRKSKKQKKIEKIRRRKRRRSKRAKEKMLRNKKKRAEKKKLRQKVDLDEELGK